MSFRGKRCAFCEKDAVKHGGEHIWDDWLNRWLEVSKHNFKYSSISGTKREYQRVELDEKLPVVCTPCNTGWMSHVTGSVKTLVQYLVRDGAEVSILPSGIALLAAFTLMKATVANHAIAEDCEPFFTRADRDNLRRSLTVPASGLKMWIGAFQGKFLYSGKFVPAILSPNGPLEGVEYFTFTYVIGHLVLQLCASRWKNVLHRGFPPVTLRPNAYWDQATIQFWPRDGFPVSWPPPKYLNDERMEEFVNRFKLPILLR